MKKKIAHNVCGLAKERDLKNFRSAIVPQFIRAKMFIVSYRSLSFAKPFVRRCCGFFLEANCLKNKFVS